MNCRKRVNVCISNPLNRSMLACIQYIRWHFHKTILFVDVRSDQTWMGLARRCLLNLDGTKNAAGFAALLFTVARPRPAAAALPNLKHAAVRPSVRFAPPLGVPVSYDATRVATLASSQTNIQVHIYWTLCIFGVCHKTHRGTELTLPLQYCFT